MMEMSSGQISLCDEVSSPNGSRKVLDCMEHSVSSSPSPPPLDVLTVGDICVDLIVRGNVRPQFGQVEQIVEDCSLELGGSAPIFASQLAKLGTRVGVIGWTGCDGMGQFVVEQLRAAGVDTTNIRQHASLKTGIGIALSEENDRAILTYMGTIDATSPADVSASSVPSCRHWHTASYFLLKSLRLFWPRWFRACREAGVSISLDTNWDPENRWQDVRDLLPLVDIFLPNENEALAISGENNALDAARSLAAYGPMVVVKSGPKGTIAVDGAKTKTKTWTLSPSPETGLPEAVVDTTGAGDNFVAGFIHQYLKGADVEECMQFGHRCAISSLAHPGGVRGQLWPARNPIEVSMGDRNT